jgi:hypothetical protein
MILNIDIDKVTLSAQEKLDIFFGHNDWPEMLTVHGNGTVDLHMGAGQKIVSVNMVQLAKYLGQQK